MTSLPSLYIFDPFILYNFVLSFFFFISGFLNVTEFHGHRDQLIDESRLKFHSFLFHLCMCVIWLTKTSEKLKDII